MTKEQFISLLRNPSTIDLNMISGLEEITERFPYFQNAHLLLAKQYHGHENIRYESYLRKASAYASDRKLLYRLIKQEPAHVIHMSVETDHTPANTLHEFNEDLHDTTDTTTPEVISSQNHLSVIDEKELTSENTIQEDLMQIPVVEVTNEKEIVLNNESTNITVDPQTIIEQRLRELAQEKNNPVDKSVTENIEKNTPVINIENQFQNLHAEKTLQTEITPVPDKNNLVNNNESHSFTEWLRLKSVPVIPDDKVSEYLITPEAESSILPIEKEIKKADNQLIEKFIKTEPRIVPSRSEFYSPGNMARLSAREHEDLISETLARIYAQQGNDRKAIETYRKLALKIPEKSGYFAALIRELEEKDKKPNP